MSKYSGKCDLADWVEISGGFENFMKTNPKIYVGDSKEMLSFSVESELMPYYPYVISVGSFSNDCEQSSYIRLMSESWVDHEEKRRGNTKIGDYYRERLKEDIEAQKIKDGVV